MKAIRYFPYGDSNDIAKVKVNPKAKCEHDWCEKVFCPSKARWPFVCSKCGKSAGCDKFGGVKDGHENDPPSKPVLRDFGGIV